MQDFKEIRKRLVSCSLLLSLMLTGCSDRSYNVGNSTAKYKDGKASGIVNYEDVEKNFKIITFSQDGVVFTRPVLISKSSYVGGTTTGYIDMESGAVLIQISTPRGSKEIQYDYGENLEIIEEKAFVPYLFSEDNIQLKYNMSDLVTFYQEKVEPTLEDNSEKITK